MSDSIREVEQGSPEISPSFPVSPRGQVFAGVGVSSVGLAALGRILGGTRRSFSVHFVLPEQRLGHCLAASVCKNVEAAGSVLRGRGRKGGSLPVDAERDSSWVQRFVGEPNRDLPRMIPKLSRVIGEHRVIGKVEMCAINLYRTEGAVPDGVVLIGDAAQNVCPLRKHCRMLTIAGGHVLPGRSSGSFAAVNCT